MKLTADKDGFPRYFSAKLGWREHFDPKELEMLANGVVPSLITPEAVQGKKNKVIRYNISSYSTVEFYISCILSREQLADLLLQCIDTFRKMQRIYLDYKNLILQPDQIFIALQSREVHFIYLPLANTKRTASLPDFFQKLLTKAGRSTYEQVSFLDNCIAWLGRPAPFTLEEFDEFIRRNSGIGGAKEEVAPPPPAPPPQSPIYVYQPPVRTMEKSSSSTVPLGSVDNQPSSSRFFLEREKTGDRIAITGTSFLVGSEAGSVSYLVEGNPAISRRHALFTLRDGRWLVADQNSLNKTYLNGLLLTPLEENVLSDGDQLRLANEMFRFVEEPAAEEPLPPVNGTVKFDQED